MARDGTKPEGYLAPAEAEDMLREMLTAAPRRPVKRARSSAAAMTLREACSHWLRWGEADREVKRSTLGDYRNVCDRICRDLGAQTRVSAITTERLEEWMEGFQAERRLSAAEGKRRRAAGVEVRRLADGAHVQLTPASSRTKRKYLIALNGIMKRAMKLGAIASNPVALVDRPGRLRTRKTLATTQFLRPADVHALVRVAGESSGQDAAMFMVAAFCGLRLGELLELRWSAVDFAGSSLHVESSYVRNAKGTPKSGAGRTVPMAADTFGTVCAAKGIPQTTIKEWMGHSDLATTEIYTAFYPQEADAARISAAFAEGSGAQLAW